MNRNRYYVSLKGYKNTVVAFTKEEAVILIQAEAIKQGRDYALISVEMV